MTTSTKNTFKITLQRVSCKVNRAWVALLTVLAVSAFMSTAPSSIAASTVSCAPQINHYVSSATLYRKWLALGGQNGALGCLTGTHFTSSRIPVFDFQYGSVYAYGDWYAIYGSIFAAFKANGGEATFGVPTTDELSTSDGKGRFSHTIYATLVWYPNEPVKFYHPLYRFGMRSYIIEETRSADEDTNHLYIGIFKGDEEYSFGIWDRGDEEESQQYTDNFHVQNYLGDKNARYTFQYRIENNGHDNNDIVEQALRAVGKAVAAKVAAEAGTAAASATGPIGPIVGLGVTAAVGAILFPLVNDAVDVAFANCDGTVALGVINADLIQLAKFTEGRRVYVQEFDHPGTDSPHGCGSNSYYRVTWSLERVDP